MVGNAKRFKRKMHEKRNEDEDTMRHAFIPQCGGIRLLAALLPLCICLWLTGCGARPDSGTLTPTRVDENTAFYLDISGKGVNADDLKYTIMGYIQSDAGLSMADAPGPDVLVIRVDVREIFAAGSSSLDARETLGTTATGVMLGTLVGGLAGGRSGALIGAGVGAATGVGVSALDSRTKTTWAMRAGVGMARGKTPDTLEELVVSADGVSSREEALPVLQDNLAQRISKSITTSGAKAEAHGE